MLMNHHFIENTQLKQVQTMSGPETQQSVTVGMDEYKEPGYIAAARRAPSAHNAQPWRLHLQADGSYTLCYAYADKLLADPDDRDALLGIGAFYETLALAANLEG